MTRLAVSSPRAPVHAPRLRPAAALTAALLLSVAGCGDDAKGEADAAQVSFDRAALLAHLATRFFVPVYEEVAARAEATRVAIDAHCTDLGAGNDATASLAGAREAWTAAAIAWQRADAVLIGPAAMDSKAGRDRIYAWPLAAPCGVDEEVVSHAAAPDAYDVATRVNNVRSLAAVEYLLFVDGPEHSCPTTPDGWDELGADLPLARCELARDIAADVAAQAEIVRAAWSPESGDFAGELARADSDAVPSLRDAVNLLSDGLFYVDKMVKDMKLGEAAGITINSCGSVMSPCLREVEHPYADGGKAAIVANLGALREVFTGETQAGDGPGFDDYLREVGAPEVADRMIANLDDAIAKAEALPDSYLGSLADDYDQVVALHAAVKLFTDDLKSQFLTVLGLDAPDDVATDND